MTISKCGRQTKQITQRETISICGFSSVQRAAVHCRGIYSVAENSNNGNWLLFKLFGMRVEMRFSFRMSGVFYFSALTFELLLLQFFFWVLNMFCFFFSDLATVSSTESAQKYSESFCFIGHKTAYLPLFQMRMAWNKWSKVANVSFPLIKSEHFIAFQDFCMQSKCILPGTFYFCKQKITICLRFTIAINFMIIFNWTEIFRKKYFQFDAKTKKKSQIDAKINRIMYL